MKKFIMLHYGFVKPTPEIMEAWGKWFESINDELVDRGGHFVGGREISSEGTKDLPIGLDSITGFNIVSADRALESRKRSIENRPELMKRHCITFFVTLHTVVPPAA